MISTLIVDDEYKNSEALAKMLTQFCHDVKIIGKAASVKEAKEIIEECSPELVMLDIEMPGEDGFQLLEDLENPDFEVIFTTAHAEYAIKAIKFAALDYLLKPINLNELKIAVERAITNIRNKHTSNLSEQINVLRENRLQNKFDFKKIALPTGDGIDFYEVDNILRCEADRAYCNFYLVGGKKVVVSKSLKEFEELLIECNFYRVHKSNMVNLNHIDKYYKGKGGYVMLSDGSHVDVSVRRKDGLMDILANYRK